MTKQANYQPTSAIANAIVGIRAWLEAGHYNPNLSGLPEPLKNHPLMRQVWDGIDASQVWDCHAHIIGSGDSGQSGAWATPRMDTWLHPILKIQKWFHVNGAGLDRKNEDISFVSRLAHLSSEMPAGYKTMLFAFEWSHNEAGEQVKQDSIFHIPNDYAAKIVDQHPQHFEWVASIHPYRKDAIDALEQAHAQGAVAMKWLASSMNIDPASPKCTKFYQKLQQLNMPIITHVGRESAVPGGDLNFNNPLKVRYMLDAGVRVVMAHCASDGMDKDYDNGNQLVTSFALFARMMDKPEYEKLLFGDISATTLFNHAWVLKHILQRTDWHHRLHNGTDYPLPGVFPLISSEQFYREGMLAKEHIPFLQEVRKYNPIMFDFAMKRLLCFEGKRFPASVFETRGFFQQSSS
ncbi:MAG TPA: amidohydrolase [Methylotenera sp.]|nr:amidohydrolase [Methylotenera sp.]HPH04627.1 amidohydrolase [Methylotenera sp.]HPN01600.1 amidohydrolase [Methylotenera sp.]